MAVVEHEKRTRVAFAAATVITAFFHVGCVVSTRGTAATLPDEGLPKRDRPHVLVLSGEMPGALRDISRHSWIVANVVDGAGARRYRRYQWLGKAEAKDTDNPFDYFGSGAVAIHGVVTDDVAEKVACLERETKLYDDFNCGCWPGPNSNTFADGLIRKCGLGIELPATALGKDYRGVIGASITEGRTGVQLETWPFGVKIGAKEGVGVDLAGLPVGVHFWPPGIDLPFNPGRVGWDSSIPREPDPMAPDHRAWPRGEEIEHELGAASLSMAASYDRIAMPALAGGLSDRATFGLRGHAVYGKTIGYAFGFDLGLGAAAPLGFVYSAHIHPAGLGFVLGDMGFIGVFSGFGTSGASGSYRAAAELPQELRFELDIARLARLGLRGGVVVIPAADHRKTFETFFGATTRLGTRASGRFERKPGSGAAAGGFFLGLERRELVDTFMLGATFGYEIGAGG